MANINETGTLVAAASIRGTAVYNTAGEALGSIDDLMVDAQTGRVAYALMSFGGFLGIGERYHPLPWAMLDYDRDKRRFVVSLSKATLLEAPTYGPGEKPHWGERSYEEAIHDYYKTDRYWITPMP
jgi:hypothetical protein